MAWSRGRGGFGRRRQFRSRLRWAKPALWTGCTEQVIADAEILSSPQDCVESADTGVTAIIKGAAPFKGVTNAAGVLTGTILGERQTLGLVRLVGRLQFSLFMDGDDDVVVGPWGIRVEVFWGIQRVSVDDNGIPDEPVAQLNSDDDQDGKEHILYQDVWTTVFAPGQNLLSRTEIPLNQGAPLYDFIDIRPKKRRAGNEQAFVLSAWFRAFGKGQAWGPPSPHVLKLMVRGHLRPLVSLGR